MTTTPAPLQSVCPDCGTPFTREDRNGRCTTCQPVRVDPDKTGRPASDRRGYDWRWRRLSERARAMQPFCTDCGSPYDLTTDHTPEAWERRAAGKLIRLKDIDVVCRSCNAARGAARGQRTTNHHDRGGLHRLLDQCPVCRVNITPTDAGLVRKHHDRCGTHCIMSGQPFPEREW